MVEKYMIVYKGGEGEVVEKKSRFIGTVFPIKTEEEANSLITIIKKKYYNAAHNCFAYVLGEKHQTQRCSDDGEPSGTAGRPMLEVLLGEDVHDVLIVVTRYFGGTLLGTGGLVRAYTRAAQEGLAHSVILEKCKGKKYLIQTDYNSHGKIQYIINQMELTLLDTDYSDKVIITVIVPLNSSSSFEKKVAEATAGQAGIEIEAEVEYGVVDGNVTLFG